MIKLSRLRRALLRILLVFLLTASLVCVLSVESEGALPRVSSSELLNNTFVYDGREVVYFGEVVGGVMERGEYAWLNVYDGDYAVGIYTPMELLDGLSVPGDYNNRGDMVEVTGVFNRACREHGGDFDIHANSIRLVSRGYMLEHPVNAPQVAFTILLLVSTIPLAMIYSRIKNGSQK